MQGFPPPITEPGKEPDPLGLGIGTVAPSSTPSIMPGAPAPIAPSVQGGEGLKRDIVNAMAAQQAGGSILDRQKPEWYRNLPNKFGATPGTAMQAGLDTIDKMLSFGPQPTDAGGAGKAAGVFRELGLIRKGGSMTPAAYAEAVEKLPKFSRFQHLSQKAAERKLGPAFEVSRAGTANDTLIKALAEGGQAPVTAVSTAPEAAWIGRSVSERIGQGIAENTRRPSFIATGVATPKDVVGLLPTRKTSFPGELEYILKPGGFQGDISTKFIPGDKMHPFVERRALKDADELARQIMKKRMK